LIRNPEFDPLENDCHEVIEMQLRDFIPPKSIRFVQLNYLYNLPFAGLRSVWKGFSDQVTQDLSALHQLTDIFSSVTTANQEKLVPVSTPPVPPNFVPLPSVAPPAPGPRVEPVLS
jgi:hypothetical protein